MTRKNMRLGEMLLAAGLIDEFQLNSALSYQRNWGARLGACLVRLGYLTEANLLNFLAEQLKLPCIDLSRRVIEADVLAFLPAEKAREYTVIPVDRREMQGTLFLLVAMSDPTNLGVVDDLQFMTGCRVRPALASEASIREAIESWYGPPPAEEAESAAQAEASPVAAYAGPPRLPVATGEPAPPPVETTEEKLQRLLRILAEKGILSLREYERLQ